MQDRSWIGSVEVLLEDGTPLGEATLRLQLSAGLENTPSWHGDIRSPVTVSKPWPADRPVRLHLETCEVGDVWLEPGVEEVGPVLVQLARVRAGDGAFESLLSGRGREYRATRT